MKLKAWLKANPQKAKGFRDRIGVSKQALNRYVHHERVPDDEVMPKIARQTAYEVTANDFYGIDPAKAAKAHQRLDEAAA